MPTFPFPATATIKTRAVVGQDGDGNDVYADTLVSTSGAFAPEGSTVLIQGQYTVLDHDTFYLSDGAPTPDSGDHLLFDGDTYTIDGRPLVYRNPLTGDQPGAELHLTRVTG